MTTERNTAPQADDDPGPLSRVAAEAWLRALGEALLAAQDHDAARRVFNTATHETAGRLPYDFGGRAARLLEKQMRTINERTDRGAAPTEAPR